MSETGKTSSTARHLSANLAALNGEPAVQCAALATEDGLAMVESSAATARLAALAGFLAAVTQQSCAMLGLDGCDEIKVTLDGDNVLLCRIFKAGEARLLLAVVYSKFAPAHRRQLEGIIKAVQKAVGD